jgi:chemotaxis protein methyltransferase CheR
MVEQVAPEEAMLAALSLRRDELANIELQLFLDAILRYAGCDFRQLNQAVLRRRIADSMRALGLDTISALQNRLLHDERALAAFIVSVRGKSGQLFADAELLRAFCANVVPLLRTYPFIRIWMPGSATGADAFSLAALLADAGILAKTLIYATCINDATLALAKARWYEHEGVQRLNALGHQAGLRAKVADYFEVDGQAAAPREHVRSSVMFARHDPTVDGSINEFVAIVARGLLPLYNGAAQYRLHRLFFESLAHLGFLILGPNESLAGTVHERAFRQVVRDHPIFRRMR